MVDENTDLEQLDPTAFVPYTEVATAALAMLDEAISSRLADQLRDSGFGGMDQRDPAFQW